MGRPLAAASACSAASFCALVPDPLGRPRGRFPGVCGALLLALPVPAVAAETRSEPVVVSEEEESAAGTLLLLLLPAAAEAAFLPPPPPLALLPPLLFGALAVAAVAVVAGVGGALSAARRVAWLCVVFGYGYVVR